MRNMKLFNKVFIIYAAIIIVAVFALAQIITDRMMVESLKRDIRYNQLMLHSMDSFITQKMRNVLQIAQQIHNGPSADDRPVAYLEQDEGQHNDYFIARNRFINYLQSSFAIDGDLSGLTVLKKRDRHIYQVSRAITRQLPADSYPRPDMLQQIDDFSTSMAVYAAHPSYNQERGQHYTLAINLKSTEDFENIGTLMADFRADGLTKAMAIHYDDIKGVLLVLTGDGQVVYDSSGQYYEARYPHSNLLQQQAADVVIDGEPSIVNVRQIEDLGLMAVGIISKKQALQGFEDTRNLVYLISLLCILTILLLSFVMTRMFLLRIRSILLVFKKVRKGDLTARIPLTRSKDELYEISDSFNTMCDELELYINKVFVSELKQKQSQLVALQAQINPHFLSNTLEAIRMNANSHGAKEAAEMIYILSLLFRNAVKEGMATDIRTEIGSARLYLKLFEIRYGSRLETSFDIEEAIMDGGIIRHTMQPLIENYIMHGFDGSAEGNRICIRAARSGSFIVIELQDNGSGIDEHKLGHIRRKLELPDNIEANNIGLANVNQRIKLIMGKDCGIEIDSVQGKGTVVKMKIKAITVKELRSDVQSTHSG